MTPRPLLALLAGVASAGLTVALASLLTRTGTEPRLAWAAAVLVALTPAGLATLHAARGRRGLAFIHTLLASNGLGVLLLVGLRGPDPEREPPPLARSDVGSPTPARPAEPPPPDDLTLALSEAPAEPSSAPADALILPYEGEGRRLTIPVAFEHNGRLVETFMMLDTGATYTTLSDEVLTLLGAHPSRDAPRLTLTTANGIRESAVTLIDRVWLGDLAVPGVAITPCEDCAGRDADGLLGLNVAGGFNVTIDADRREVVLQPRARTDRHLDVRPFVDLEGSFSRYPNGRVEVALGLTNRAPYDIDRVVTRIRCDEEVWHVVSGPVDAGAEERLTRRLPSHPPCAQYQISMEGADWAVSSIPDQVQSRR